MPTHDLRAYIKIEEGLTRRFMRAWRPEFARLYKAMLAHVEAGNFPAAYDEAAKIDFTHVAKSTSEYVKFSLWNAAVFGAKCAHNGVTATDLGDHDALLNRVTKVVVKTLERNVTLQVYRAAIRSIDAAKAAATVTKAEGKKRFVRDFVSFKEDGDQMLQLVSSLHTSRLAVWGFTAEATVYGITTYRLQAVLDGRTSKFCTFIDGREFQVSDARTFIVNALNASSPEDLKTLHPWPKQDLQSLKEFHAMTNDELRARGYFVPPFHPHCRTLCLAVGLKTVEEAGELPEVAAADFTQVTPEQFEQLKLPIDLDDLAHWQKVVAESPTSIVSKLFGLPGTKVLDGVVESQVAFNEDGSISVGGKTKATKLNMVLDPFDGTLYLNHAEFQNQGPAKAADSLKGLLSRVNKMAQAKGMDTTVSTSGGAAYSLATAGFLPTAAGWKAIQSIATSKLALTTLPGSQSAAVKLILQSNNPEGILALAALPYEVDGVPIGEYLLSRVEIEMTLTGESPAQDLFSEWAGE